MQCLNAFCHSLPCLYTVLVHKLSKFGNHLREKLISNLLVPLVLKILLLNSTYTEFFEPVTSLYPITGG